MLLTYSPVIVVLAWAFWIVEIGRSDATQAAWLLAFATAMWAHVREERRGR